MSTQISRTHYNTLIDDDGSGTTGSIWDKADVDALLDAIDAIFAGSVTFGNGIAEYNRAFALGAWQTVAFNAANFTGSGAMTVTVQSSDHIAFRYCLVGNMMWVFLDLQSVSVGGTPSNIIQVAIPGGVSGLFDNQGYFPIRVHDNGASGTTGMAVVRNNGSGINIYRDLVGGTNWSASTNATHIQGTIGPFAVA